MKKLLCILPITGILLALLCTAAVGSSSSDFAGKWELDGEKSTGVIDDLYLMFGSSVHHCGAEIVISPDGGFAYHIGLTGGEGSYTVSGDTLTAGVLNWNDPHEDTLSLRLIRENDRLYLLYPYRDEAFSVDLWWIKKE